MDGGKKQYKLDIPLFIFITMKICAKCKIKQDISNYHKNINSKDGLKDRCKICVKEYDIKNYQNNRIKNLLNTKRWQSENREILLNYQKSYYESNKDLVLKYHDIYRINNKDKISQQIKQWKINQRKSNPTFVLMETIRHRFHKAIKSGTKYKSSIDLIGCSVEELKKKIESQWKPEMNWGNYGKIWEIDHIISCYKFDLSILEEQQKCFHYSNLQPLFKTTRIAQSFGYINEIGNRNKHKN